VPNSQAVEEKILKKSTQTKSNQNNHGHAYLPSFGIILKKGSQSKHGKPSYLQSPSLG